VDQEPGAVRRSSAGGKTFSRAVPMLDAGGKIVNYFSAPSEFPRVFLPGSAFLSMVRESAVTTRGSFLLGYFSAFVAA
jgi:hypothetical protein